MISCCEIEFAASNESCPKMILREPYRDEGDGSTRLLVPEEGGPGGHNRESSFERRLAVPPRASAVAATAGGAGATASLDRGENLLWLWWSENRFGYCDKSLIVTLLRLPNSVTISNYHCTLKFLLYFLFTS